MRARNIKPGFFSNEDLVEVSFAARLLFIGLWTLADREGRLEDRPMKIKIQLFPADDVNVDAELDELQDHGFIQRYGDDRGRFIQVLNFDKHQRPHTNEKESEIPPVPESVEQKPEQFPFNEPPTANQDEPDGAPRSEVVATKDGSASLLMLNPDSLIPDSPNVDTQIKTAPKKSARDDITPPNAHYELYTLCCELNGGNPKDNPDPAKQLAVFQRLIAKYGFDPTANAMRWMGLDEFWQRKGFDAFNVERNIDKYLMMGQPDELRGTNGGTKAARTRAALAELNADDERRNQEGVEHTRDIGRPALQPRAGPGRDPGVAPGVLGVPDGRDAGTD